MIGIQVVCQVLIGHYLLDASFPESPGGLVLALVLGAASFAALGLAVTGLVRSSEGSSAIVNAIYLPMTFICGVFFSAPRSRDSSRRSQTCCPSRTSSSWCATCSSRARAGRRRPWPSSPSGESRARRRAAHLPLGAASLVSRYGFVAHPESVTLVVIDGDELVLVRQSRPGARRAHARAARGRGRAGRDARAGRRERARRGVRPGGIFLAAHRRLLGRARPTRPSTRTSTRPAARLWRRRARPMTTRTSSSCGGPSRARSACSPTPARSRRSRCGRRAGDRVDRPAPVPLRGSRRRRPGRSSRGSRRAGCRVRPRARLACFAQLPQIARCTGSGRTVIWPSSRPVPPAVRTRPSRRRSRRRSGRSLRGRTQAAGSASWSRSSPSTTVRTPATGGRRSRPTGRTYPRPWSGSRKMALTQEEAAMLGFPGRTITVGNRASVRPRSPCARSRSREARAWPSSCRTSSPDEPLVVGHRLGEPFAAERRVGAGEARGGSRRQSGRHRARSRRPRG